MNLVELLQSIADAIRTKTKSTDKINAQDFPTAIANIKGGSGNATSADVLSGKTFTNDDGEQTGAMSNNGTISTTISQGGSYTIPQGYHSGSGVVKATANSGNASTSQVLSGYTFYSNSATKQTGSMTNRGAVSATISPGGSYTIPQGYHSGSGKVSASSGSNPTVVSQQYTIGDGGTSLSYTFASGGTYRVVAMVFASGHNGNYTRMYTNATKGTYVSNGRDMSSSWGAGWLGGMSAYVGSTSKDGSIIYYMGTVIATTNQQILVKTDSSWGAMILHVEKLIY